MKSMLPSSPPTAELTEVVIAEDTPAILELECLILREAGFSVCGHTSLEDAARYLQALAAQGVAPALLIVDLELPGGSGLELAPWIDRSRTALLVISGIAAWRAARQLEEGRCDAFLNKPFDPDELVRLTRGLLRGTPAAPLVARNDPWRVG